MRAAPKVLVAVLSQFFPCDSRYSCDAQLPVLFSIFRVYCCRFIRSLISSRTGVKLKVFGEQLQSSCRCVKFDLTVLDSKRTFHRVFDRRYLDITHVE